MNSELVSPRGFSDERGTLNLVESPKELPFLPRRVFWVTDVPKGSKRGLHAHRTGHQILFCLRGSIEITLKTHDYHQSALLTEDGTGIWMKNMTWGEQTFLSDSAILLVLASNEYEEMDYIRDLGEFLTLSKQGL